MAQSYLYQKVYDTLLERIRAGELTPGDRLPGEEELARQFGVSAITVKKALGLLAGEGLIKRVSGRGSFVTRPHTSGSDGGPPALGLVMEHVSSPFGLDMLYALDRLAADAGCRLIMGFSYGDRELETLRIVEMLAAGVRGILLMPTHGRYYSTDVLRLAVEGYPLVLIDKQLEGVPLPSVCTDNALAAGMLVRHLHERGRRRPGFITAGNTGTSSVDERRRGFLEAAAELSMEPVEPCEITVEGYGAGQDSGAGERIRDYLVRHRGVMDAVVCAEYSFLPPLVAAARSLDVDIPAELAVCSVDEDYLAPGGWSFTHVRQDEQAIAAKAMALLLQRLDGGGEPVRCSVAPLFRRGSST